MITDADIKKMKAVFATKEDLKSFATKDEINKRFDNLSKNLHKSTNDLVELITNGFNLTEKRIERLEDKVFGTN